MLLTKRAGSWLAIVLLAGSRLRLPLGSNSHGPTTSTPGGLTLIWPDRLRPGDTIMFVAPAGDLREERILKPRVV